MEPEFAELLPLFASEARERLERLVQLVGALEGDEGALVEAKRELHTVKGAARMMNIPAVAELAHAAESLVKTPRGDVGPLLLRAADRLLAMVEVAAEGRLPVGDPELVAELTAPRFTDSEASVAPPVTSGFEPTTAATAESAASPVAGAAARPPARPQAPGLQQVELRLDPARMDQLADGAAQLRLLTLAGHVHAERMYELAHLAEQGVREPMPIQVLALLASSLRRAAVELEGRERRLVRLADGHFETVLGLQLQPLRPSFTALSRHARELARSLGGEVEVVLSGEDTRLDRRITHQLEGVLVHLVRNAIDHGLEPAAARVAAGKPPGGRLTLAASSDGARVRLEIADDGRGIDLEAVVRKAVGLGLVRREAAARMPREEALRLIFLPGFSTRDQVSELSGRGVGLDAVWSAVTRVGGEVGVESQPGSGTTFWLTVPVARRGEQVLVLRVGRLRVALPRGVVERVERLAVEQLVERGGQVLARVPWRDGERAAGNGDGADDGTGPADGIGERLLACVPLARLFGETTPREVLLLAGRVAGQSLALLADAVEGEEEVLVRPLGRVIGGLPFADGLALLASGDPVMVLSPAALARPGLLAGATRPVAAAPAVRRLRLLLVDDSLVTREMERRLLVDAGFEVIAAADATEALTHLGESAFDCVITDVEMPGMDGFALVRHLRDMPHLAALPVVVVSTRDRPEDRLHGLEAGADAYLTKQGLDAGELVGVVRRLAG